MNLLILLSLLSLVCYSCHPLCDNSLAHSLTRSLGHWGKGLLGNNVRVAQVSVRAVEYTDVLMLSKKQYRELKGELHPKDFEV